MFEMIVNILVLLVQLGALILFLSSCSYQEIQVQRIDGTVVKTSMVSFGFPLIIK